MRLGGRPRPTPVVPGPGQESVWEYPRPAVAQTVDRRVQVWFAGRLIVEARPAVRVLETSHPPTYYVPPESIAPGVLVAARGDTLCEWKGAARYFDVVVGDRRARRAAWCYPEPSPAFRHMAGFVAFYPALMDSCRVDGHTVTPQPGGFYGGWVTPDIVGPVKGEPGTEFW